MGESFLHPLNHCLAAIQLPLCLISHLNVSSLLSQPCPGLHLGTLFCGNRLLFVVAIAVTTGPFYIR